MNLIRRGFFSVEGITMKHAFLLILIASFTILQKRAREPPIKSEVAGQDLPFSDAALVGDTLYIAGKGVILYSKSA